MPFNRFSERSRTTFCWRIAETNRQHFEMIGSILSFGKRRRLSDDEICTVCFNPVQKQINLNRSKAARFWFHSRQNNCRNFPVSLAFWQLLRCVLIPEIDDDVKKDSDLVGPCRIIGTSRQPCSFICIDLYRYRYMWARKQIGRVALRVAKSLSYACRLLQAAITVL